MGVFFVNPLSIMECMFYQLFKSRRRNSFFFFGEKRINEEHPSKMLMFLHKICIIKFKEFSFCQPYIKPIYLTLSSFALVTFCHHKCVFYNTFLVRTLCVISRSFQFSFHFLSFSLFNIQRFSFIQH